MMFNLFRLVLLCLILFIFACSSEKEFVFDGESPESLLERGRIALENGQYNEALKMNQFLLEEFPTSDLHIDAQLTMSEALAGKEKFEDQLDLLLRLLKENIIPEKVPLIYMQIGKFYENSANWNPGNITSDTLDWEKAAQYYRKAVFYPNSKDSKTKAAALYKTALMHAKIRDVDTAKKAYEELVAVYPASPYSSLAKIKLLDPSNTDELSIESVLVEKPAEEVTPEIKADTQTQDADFLLEEPSQTEDQQFQDIISTPESDTSQTDLPIEDWEDQTTDEQPAILDSIQSFISDTSDQNIEDDF